MFVKMLEVRVTLMFLQEIHNTSDVTEDGDETERRTQKHKYNML